MFYYVFSFAIVIFEIICCKLFFDIFTNKSHRTNKKKEVLLLLLLVLCSIFTAMFLRNHFTAKEIMIICEMALIMKLINRESLKKNFVLALFSQGLVLLVDYVVFSVTMTLFSNQIEIKNNYPVQGQLLVVLGKIVLLICVLFIHRRFRMGFGTVMTDSEWIRFLAFPTFSILTITAMILNFQQLQNQKQAIVLYIIALGMIGMNLLVYYLIHDIMEREIRIHQQGMFEIQMKNQMEMYQSIADSYERQKRKSHEFQNQIICIESLVRQENFKELKEYVEEISDNFHEERNVINTNHTIVNAIFNTKYAEAVSKRITMIFKVNDLSSIRISNQDLVILLCNLLNNAMEACEKCQEKRIIKIKFLLQKEEIVLAISNTNRTKVQYVNSEIVTSKKNNPQEHGVGIKNIVRIIEQYQGIYSIKEEESEFQFSIIIPNNVRILQ